MSEYPAMTEEREDLLEDDTLKNRYLLFMIDDDEYGIEVKDVKEVITAAAITQVPQTPDYVKGIINLRGVITAVLDVRTRFMKPERPYDEFTCFVIIFHRDGYLGLVVDSISECVTIDEEQILPPPSAKLNHHNQFVRNIANRDGRIELLLDLEKFLGTEG